MTTNWENIIKQTKSEIVRKLGNLSHQEDNALVCIKLAVILDCNNNPVVWIMDSTKIAPASKAKLLTDDNMALELLKAY